MIKTTALAGLVVASGLGFGLNAVAQDDPGHVESVLLCTFYNGHGLGVPEGTLPYWELKAQQVMFYGDDQAVPGTYFMNDWNYFALLGQCPTEFPQSYYDSEAYWAAQEVPEVAPVEDELVGTVDYQGATPVAEEPQPVPTVIPIATVVPTIPTTTGQPQTARPEKVRKVRKVKNGNKIAGGNKTGGSIDTLPPGAKIVSTLPKTGSGPHASR